MTAKEIREYRATSRKLVDVEERSKLLEELKRRGVCLGEEEKLIQKMQNKFKILGNKVGVMRKQHDEIVSTTLKFKLRDNNLLVAKIRKKRNWLRRRLEEILGSRSCKCRAIVEEVKKSTNWQRDQIKKKNKKKVDNLVWDEEDDNRG